MTSTYLLMKLDIVLEVVGNAPFITTESFPYFHARLDLTTYSSYSFLMKAIHLTICTLHQSTPASSIVALKDCR